MAQEGLDHIVQVEPKSKVSQSVAKWADSTDQTLPTCLLCLNRSPNAVLLPCCHLNVCSLCASVLMTRCRLVSQAEPSAIPASVALKEARIPFNAVLARATANHPKSRMLAMGGYSPPIEGHKGGEFLGGHLATDEVQGETGLKAAQCDDGRVELSMAEGTPVAKCPVCRGGVNGWLRVYAS